MIKKCERGCQHEFQDQTYGKSMRVHTVSKKDGAHRCTVCGPLPAWQEKLRMPARNWLPIHGK